MKIATVFVFFLLVGCGAQPTLEELETQAFASGDWSAVEARERSIARRAARFGNQCPSGYASYCENHHGSMECTCLKLSSFQMSFTGP
jgi:hypothetical protein